MPNTSAMLVSRPKNDATVLGTTGVYRRMRHPMYTAHVLWSLGTALVLGNWLAGPLGLLGMLAVVFVRVPREEAALIEQFGEDYRNYMDQTWGIVPKPGGKNGSWGSKEYTPEGGGEATN